MNIVVQDALTGKPVEGAEVSFKALIGKLTRKTNSEGKATFEMFLLLKTQDMKYTVTFPKSSKTYQPYTGNITLVDGKDVFDYTAAIKPDTRRLSFKISDDKSEPVSSASVKLKHAKGTEFSSQTDANGVALFDVDPIADLTKSSLTVSKQGLNSYTIPVDINDETTQLAIVAPTAPAVMMVDGTSGLTDPPQRKSELLGTTGNIIQTSMPPGYSPKPKNAAPVWGPYTPDCDANPLANVPIYTPFAVEDEKTILDNISSSCIGAAGDAVTALVEATDKVVSVSSTFRAIWHQGFKQREPGQIITTASKVYDETKKLAEEETEKTKKAIEDAIEKSKELFDKMKELAAGPEMYALNCIWDGIKDYATPEPLAKLKKSTAAFEKAKTAMQKKLEGIQRRLASGKALNVEDKELFTEWGDVTENIEKTTEGLNLILSYIKDPRQILPYETQVSLALNTAETMSGSLLSDCQIRECDRQIKQGVTAGQAALTAARKHTAQMKKGETKWRQIINDYVTKNFTPENRGWEYFSSNDPRLLMLPQGAYGSWVNYHNDAIRGERESAKLEGLLNRLAELCTKIQPLAATLNERVNKYEGLYTKGIIALENCKLEEATAFFKQLQSLETGECGHFFPRPYGKTKSEDLQEKINKIKATGKCGTKKGIYSLASVVPFQGNDYYKISETVYEYKSDKGGYIFTLQNPPPSAISPKETFDISISAKCLEKDPVLDYYTNNIWTAGESRVAFAGNKNIIIGKFEGKVIPEANETLKITVPEFDGPEVNLVLRIGHASYSEPTSYERVKFVYKKG